MEENSKKASRNNLFNYATSELSQDAFIAWLLTFDEPEHAQEDPELSKCARDFLNAMDTSHRIPSGQHVTEILKQEQHIDVLVKVGDVNIIIEDKTFTSQHGKQICKYKENLKNSGIQDQNIITVYYKTYDETKHENNVDCSLFRPKILSILRKYRDKTDNLIFHDYLEHLESMEADAEAFRDEKNASMRDWSGVRHARFFKHLEDDKIADTSHWWSWGYVPNQNGGFQGFWWHWLSDEQLASLGFAKETPNGKFANSLHLQLENTASGAKINLKIGVDVKKIAKEDWQTMHYAVRDPLFRVMKDCLKKNGLDDKFVQTQRFGHGANITVGYLDYDMTNYKERIKAMENALDYVAANFRFNGKDLIKNS